jgi:hypothetical protein
MDKKNHPKKKPVHCEGKKNADKGTKNSIGIPGI